MTPADPPWFEDVDSGLPLPFPDAGPPERPPVGLPLVFGVDPLPPISGGSLEVSPAGIIVAGDADRNNVLVLDPAEGRVVGLVPLSAGDEPGRIAFDSSGRAHVVLRGGGAVLTIDLGNAEVLERRSVCPAPRGIAYSASGDQLWVACVGGELAALPAGTGAVTRVWRLDDDLRDVLVSGERVIVSRFRSAELLEVNPDTGEVLIRRRPLVRETEGRGGPLVREPNTAWRIRSGVDGEVVMLHQMSVSSELEVDMGGYAGGECRNGVVAPAISVFSADGSPAIGGGIIGMTPLAVDLAVDVLASRYRLARPATDAIELGFPSGTMTIDAISIRDDCVFEIGTFIGPSSSDAAPSVAVALTADGRSVTMTRDPLRITVEGQVSFEGGGLNPNRGFELFHTNTPSFTACASCHPEGGEDGITWNFAGTGLRRTQTLLGGLLETAPFHWSGDQADMSAIMQGGFMQRMGASSGTRPDDARDIGAWLEAQPLPARSVVASDAVERGRVVFEDGASACASCHSGERFTNNASMDVGTGGAFQVPSLLGVGFRAPYLHDGCAPSLEAVLAGTCTSGHGNTDALDAAALADLVAYLRSL